MVKKVQTAVELVFGLFILFLKVQNIIILRAPTAAVANIMPFYHIKDLLYYFITSFYNIPFIRYFIIQFYTLK